MNVVHRYLGESRAVTEGGTTRLGFAPDTLRAPTFFNGRVARHLPFREAISALHHVVVSDLRFKPKDRSAYFAWLQANEQQLLAEALAGRDELEAEIEALRRELTDIGIQSQTVMRPFYKARQLYFDRLYKEDLDAWIVLDPVITVHPDEIFFECFSLDESTYGRLSCDHDVFERMGEMAFGTTNIDYSHALYDDSRRSAATATPELAIDPTGFSVKTSGTEEYREDKIDLPDSWMRGFLQVSSAMTQPACVVDLHPVDMHAILTRLAARRERHGPRSLRFLLEPDRPVSVLIEPWNERLTFRRSIYRGPASAEIRLWGRRRLAILARALPLARSVRLHLLGTGLPSFAVVDYGGLRFTLGLSGWDRQRLVPRRPVRPPRPAYGCRCGHRRAGLRGARPPSLRRCRDPRRRDRPRPGDGGGRARRLRPGRPRHVRSRQAGVSPARTHPRAPRRKRPALRLGAGGQGRPFRRRRAGDPRPHHPRRGPAQPHRLRVGRRPGHGDRRRDRRG